MTMYEALIDSQQTDMPDQEVRSPRVMNRSESYDSPPLRIIRLMNMSSDLDDSLIIKKNNMKSEFTAKKWYSKFSPQKFQPGEKLK